MEEKEQKKGEEAQVEKQEAKKPEEKPTEKKAEHKPKGETQTEEKPKKETQADQKETEAPKETDKKKRRKISRMTLPEIDRELKVLQETMGGFRSAFAQHLLARKKALAGSASNH